MKKTKKQQQKQLNTRQRFAVFGIFLGIVGSVAFAFEKMIINTDASGGGILWFLVSVLVAWASIYAYVAFYTRKIEHRKGWPAELIFRPKYYFGGVALAAFVIFTQLFAIKLLGTVSFSAKPEVVNSFFMILGWAIYAGGLEELLNRGVVFRFLEKHAGSLAAVLLSATIFGSPHIFNPSASFWTGLSITIGGGTALASIFILTRSLWATIGVHFGWDLILGIIGIDSGGVYRINVSGPKWLIGDGNVSTYDPIFIVCIWLIISIVCLYLANKNKKVISYSAARHKLLTIKGTQ